MKPTRYTFRNYSLFSQRDVLLSGNEKFVKVTVLATSVAPLCQES